MTATNKKALPIYLLLINVHFKIHFSRTFLQQCLFRENKISGVRSWELLLILVAPSSMKNSQSGVVKNHFRALVGIGQPLDSQRNFKY